MANRIKIVGMMLLMLGTVILSLRAHIFAGGWMPVPWVDESFFAWPSIAFSETASFVAPQANPDRALFWMPPGYYILTGTIYSIVGYSAELMRSISWVFGVAYLLMLGHWLHREKWPVECIVIVAGFFLNGFFVVLCNTGRMEAVNLAGCLIAYWLIHRGWPWRGLTLMGVLLLVHPYVGLFGFFALVVIVLTQPASLRRFNRLDAAILGAGLLLWLVYIVYVARHIPHVLTDMARQSATHHEMLMVDLGITNDTPGWILTCKALFTTKFTPVLAACVVLGGLLWKWDRAALLLLGFGLAGLIIRVLGAEQWYVVFAVNGLMLILLAVIRCSVGHVLTRLPKRLAVPARIIQALVVIGACVAVGLIPSFKNYPDKVRWWECSMRPGDVYMTDEDAETIVSAIGAAPGVESTSRIQFKPRGEDLWFYPNSRGIFVTHAPVSYDREADFQVVHQHPTLMPLFPDLNIKTNSAILLHSRGEHRWFLKTGPGVRVEK